MTTHGGWATVVLTCSLPTCVPPHFTAPVGMPGAGQPFANDGPPRPPAPGPMAPPPGPMAAPPPILHPMPPPPQHLMSGPPPPMGMGPGSQPPPMGLAPMPPMMRPPPGMPGGMGPPLPQQQHLHLPQHQGPPQSHPSMARGPGGGGGGGGGAAAELRAVVLSGLAWWTTTASLFSKLSAFGSVSTMRFYEDRKSGKFTGYNLCLFFLVQCACAGVCKGGGLCQVMEKPLPPFWY